MLSDCGQEGGFTSSYSPSNNLQKGGGGGKLDFEAIRKGGLSFLEKQFKRLFFLNFYQLCHNFPTFKNFLLLFFSPTFRTPQVVIEDEKANKMISKLWKKGKSSITAKAKGDALENRVVRLFKKRGEWCVKKDVTLRDNFGNISQIVCILAFCNTLPSS